LSNEGIYFILFIIIFSCAHCFAPRTGDLYARFCTECGLPWQNLTQNQPRLNQPDGHSVIQKFYLIRKKTSIVL
jgi:hypothetical protein